jgi:uncharacterized membrane protein YedE/YeeE
VLHVPGWLVTVIGAVMVVLGSVLVGIGTIAEGIRLGARWVDVAPLALAQTPAAVTMASVRNPASRPRSTPR